MAQTAKTPEKKATQAKAAATPKKAPVKKKITRGQTLACQVCGLSVVVEEIGDEVVAEETTLLCCGKPMKEKVTARKPPAKKPLAKKTPAKKTPAKK